MKNFLIVFVSSILIQVFFSLTVLAYKKIDKKTKLSMTRMHLAVIYMLNVLQTYLFYRKFHMSGIYIFLLFLLFYLLITSYIDYQTQFIYRILNYFGIFIGMLFYLFQSVYGKNNAEMSGSLIILLIYGICQWLFVKIKAFGAGDGYLFVGISFYLAALFDTGRLPDILMTHMVYCFLLFFLLHIPCLAKKNKISNNQAFSPTIAVNTVLYILIVLP